MDQLGDFWSETSPGQRQASTLVGDSLEKGIPSAALVRIALVRR